MKISAIVPVWNGAGRLERLLDSLAAQTLAASEILVVDNGSTDGAPELARRCGAQVLPMGRNAGFAAAVNRGIAEAAGDHIAVLNDDVTLAPDYLEKLAAANAWFATGKLLSARASRKVDGTYDLISRGGTAWRVGSGKPDGPAFSAARDIWSAPWTAVLFRAGIFAAVGTLEESFESYLEDVDFGLRCAAAGIQGRYVPEAVGWHEGSATLGPWHADTVRRIARNQLFLLARHYPGGLIGRWLWPILVGQILWGGAAMRHGAGRAWLTGKLQGLAGFHAARAESRRPPAGVLEPLLRDSEEALRAAQIAAGPDAFWRWYFRLTGGGVK